jgi:hypothetical protein
VAQSRLPEAVQLQVKRQDRLIWLENWTGKNQFQGFAFQSFKIKTSAVLETFETLKPSI